MPTPVDDIQPDVMEAPTTQTTIEPVRQPAGIFDSGTPPQAEPLVKHQTPQYIVPKKTVTVYTDENERRPNPLQSVKSQQHPVLPWRMPQTLRQSRRISLGTVKDIELYDDQVVYYIPPGQPRRSIEEEPTYISKRDAQSTS